MKDLNNKGIEGWEKNYWFEICVNDKADNVRKDIKLFINELLERQRKELLSQIREWVEKNRGEFHTSNPIDERYDAGYDKALTDLLDYLQE